MKIISFLGARPETDRAQFQDWFLTTSSSLLAKDRPHPRSVAVNVLFDPPIQRPRRSYERDVGSRPYDIISEIWYDDPKDAADWTRQLSEAGLADRVGNHHAFQVIETEIFNKDLKREVGITPGIKFTGQLEFHDDLPRSAIKRSWSIHGELAVKTFHHLHCYVQNIVEETLTKDTPRTSGMPQLYFDSIEDFMVTPPNGQEYISHDLRHLVKSGVRLYGREHVLCLAETPR